MGLLMRSLKGVASRFIVVVWCILLLGCKAFKSPEEAVDGLFSGLKECEQKKIKKSITKASWKAIEELSLSVKAMLPEEKAKAFFPLQGICDSVRNKTLEIGTSQAQGDKTVVEVALVDEKGKRARFIVPVVEEDGGWKVDWRGFWSLNFIEKEKGE
mgnify:CR=1 FL=1